MYFPCISLVENENRHVFSSYIFSSNSIELVISRCMNVDLYCNGARHDLSARKLSPEKLPSNYAPENPCVAMSVIHTAHREEQMPYITGAIFFFFPPEQEKKTLQLSYNPN